MSSKTLPWRINTPALLREILCNPSTSILENPLQILGDKLHSVAERALLLDDPELNILMLELTLYSVNGDDSVMPNGAAIFEAIDAQKERLASTEKLK